MIRINDFLELEQTAIMIDNPFIMDNGYYPYEADNHNFDLYNMLNSENEDLVSDAFNEIIGSKKLKRVLDKLATVVPGNIKSNSQGEEVYEENLNTEPIFISNLSTGLKTFVIIKKLIQNNMLSEKSILILDEPEIHLHPEWQLIYAELVVLLQIELGLTVIITTHSPYFLNAIEVFTQKHGTKQPKYYLSNSIHNSIEFIDVSNDLEKIYHLLAKPFQTLENIKYGG